MQILEGLGNFAIIVAILLGCAVCIVVSMAAKSRRWIAFGVLAYALHRWHENRKTAATPPPALPQRVETETP